MLQRVARLTDAGLLARSVRGEPREVEPRGRRGDGDGSAAKDAAWAGAVTLVFPPGLGITALMGVRQAAEHWTKLNGRRVFYRTVPPGLAATGQPPLLLVHGISCRTETWRPFVQALARREDAPALLVPDLPAHGRSQRPEQVLGMSELAAWCARLLDECGAGPVDVMGHSMGCQVAVALAEEHPERVRRMVLLGPTTGAAHVSTIRTFAGLMADTFLEPLAYTALLLRTFLRMGPLHYLRTVREMQRDDAVRRARRVHAPALVLQGVRDAIIPSRAARELARAFPTSDYVRLPAGAHAAQYSHPEETAAAAMAFLREGQPRRWCWAPPAFPASPHPPAPRPTAICGAAPAPGQSCGQNAPEPSEKRSRAQIQRSRIT